MDAAGGRRFCLTLVTDGSPAKVYEGFGGDWDQAEPLTPQDTRAMGEGLPGRIEVPAVRAGTAAGGAFAFENASVQGARAEVLRRASAGSQAVSVSLGPGELPRLRWARDGRLAAEMVLNQPERVRGPAAAQLSELLGSEPGLRERLSGYDHHRLLPGGIALACRLCGVLAEPTALAGPLPGGLVLPVLADPRPPAEPASSRAAVLLAAAAGETAARAARAQAVRLIADLDLARFPEISEFADSLLAGQPPVITDESPLGMLIRRFASPLHWHTVTPPDITPEVRPRLVLDALDALRPLASAPGQALADVYLIRSRTARRRDAHAVTDLEEDLGQPPVDEAAVSALDHERRAQGTRRSAAVEAARREPPRALAGADAAWNWVLPYLPYGLCLTFADRIDPADLLTRLTGDPARTAVPDSPWLPAIQPGRVPRLPDGAGTGRTGTWSFGIETGSATTAEPDVLAAISSGTRAVCLRHDSSGITRFYYAEDSTLVTELDPLFPSLRSGADPGRLDAWLNELGLTADATPATAPGSVTAPYLLASRAFGIRLDHHLAAGPALTAPLTWQPPPLPGHGIPCRDTALTTPGGLTWWPRPGDPERPHRQRVRPLTPGPHPPNAPLPVKTRPRRNATEARQTPGSGE
jgi:Family of unknown function (DUF6461)